MAKHGVRLGEDLHLLSRDSDPHFGSLPGGVAHYQENSEQLVKLTCRAISLWLDHRSAEPATSLPLVETEFIEGKTLGRADNKTSSSTKEGDAPETESPDPGRPHLAGHNAGVDLSIAGGDRHVG